jgi:hypothetical protein
MQIDLGARMRPARLEIEFRPLAQRREAWVGGVFFRL